MPREDLQLSKTDALIMAATSMLEKFRALLDTNPSIKSVTLEFRISPDNTIHTVNLSPGFEIHKTARPAIDKYDFNG